MSSLFTVSMAATSGLRMVRRVRAKRRTDAAKGTWAVCTHEPETLHPSAHTATGLL
ncbi:hypothetical protein [Qipengyuania aquimaris]|uniref:hypothetical protein n=1 Tax=Qipengyuania aquimaris TaxID=255984 RepID=UPI001CD6A6FB|nr:hypothetical protein [Qipengyuania aquimaris]MCA0902474.1 hypothetical protein [Qipengyuania aquimaris]